MTPSVALARATHVVRGRLLGEPLLVPTFGTPGVWIGDQHLEPDGAPQLADGVEVLVALIQDGTAEHARLASFPMGVFQSVADADQTCPGRLLASPGWLPEIQHPLERSP